MQPAQRPCLRVSRPRWQAAAAAWDCCWRRSGPEVQPGACWPADKHCLSSSILDQWAFLRDREKESAQKRHAHADRPLLLRGAAAEEDEAQRSSLQAASSLNKRHSFNSWVA